MMSLAAFMHPLVQPAAKPAPASAMPLCGARDWVTGAVCNGLAGHYGDYHVSEDQDFEIRWPQA